MKYTQKSNQMSHSVESEEHRVNFFWKVREKGEAIAKQKNIYISTISTIEVGFR